MRNLFMILTMMLIMHSAKCQVNRSAEPLTNYDSLIMAKRDILILPSGCEEDGKIFVSFVVAKDGKVKEIQVLRGLENCPKADSIAIEITKLVKYTPEISDGVYKEVRKMIPIPFRKE